MVKCELSNRVVNSYQKKKSLWLIVRFRSARSQFEEFNWKVATKDHKGCEFFDRTRRTTLAGCKSKNAESTLLRDFEVFRGKTMVAIFIVNVEVGVNNLPGEHWFDGTPSRTFFWCERSLPPNFILQSLPFFSLDYSRLGTRNSLNSLCCHRRTFAIPPDTTRLAERAKAHPGLSRRDSPGKRKSKWCWTIGCENRSDSQRSIDEISAYLQGLDILV